VATTKTEGRNYELRLPLPDATPEARTGLILLVEISCIARKAIRAQLPIWSRRD